MDGDQAKQKPTSPSLFFFLHPPSLPNLYPPLTPVPQCVAEIRAIGQSPIHCHPEYFKVKPPRLTKKSYSSKVYFPLPFRSLPSFSRGSAAAPHAPFSLWSTVLSSHLGTVGCWGGSWKFWKFPKFPYFDLMRFGLGSDSVVLRANWSKSERAADVSPLRLRAVLLFK